MTNFTKEGHLEGVIFKHIFPMQKSQNEAGEQVFLGVASSTSIDRDSERLSKSALAKGVNDLMKNPTVFFNHKHDGLGLGKVINAYISGDKLMVEWKPSTAKAVQDHITQVNEGVLRSMSVAGSVKKAETVFDEDLQKSVRVISDVDLYEVSVVGIPANPDATIAGSIAKAFDFEKSRLATSITDANDEVKGDGGETEEKNPVVPPKKKKAVNGKEIDDDEILESAKRKGKAEKSVSESGDSMENKTAEADVQKSNQPALSEGLPTDLARFEGLLKEILGKIEAQKKGMGIVSGDTKGGANMGEKPPAGMSFGGCSGKSEPVEWQKKYEELNAKVDALEKQLVTPKGLAAPGAIENGVKVPAQKFAFE